MADRSPNHFDVFLSYHWRDQAQVEALAKWLREQNPLRVSRSLVSHPGAILAEGIRDDTGELSIGGRLYWLGRDGALAAARTVSRAGAAGGC
jgi:hypothetical protein